MKTQIAKASMALSLLVSCNAFAQSTEGSEGVSNEAKVSVGKKTSDFKVAETKCKEHFRRDVVDKGSDPQNMTRFMHNCVRRHLNGQILDSKNRIYEFEAKDSNALVDAQDKCRQKGVKGDAHSACMEEQGIKVKPVELGQVKKDDSNSVENKRKKRDGFFELKALIGLCRNNVILSHIELKTCLNLFGLKYRGGAVAKVEEDKGQIRPTQAGASEEIVISEEEAVAGQ
jgi:hypothetical protein